jgi:hypothetical protein
MISLIHPSRSRPETARAKSIDWILKSGTTEIEYFCSVDSDDPKIETYKSLFQDKALLINENRSAIDAINIAAQKSYGDILIVMSDDFDCNFEWAKHLLWHTEHRTDWIAKTPDGIQKWIITLPIMDRIYYNRFGYIYYPEYRHMFCDTEMTCVADLLQRKITLDIPFKHNHYSTGATKKDSVSERADSTWGQGEALFIERARKNFDLIDPPGKIMDEAYNNWIRRKL